jgi:hypothetical protein
MMRDQNTWNVGEDEKGFNVIRAGRVICDCEQESKTTMVGHGRWVSLPPSWGRWLRKTN